MESEVCIRLVLVDPPAGVDYGIQKGGGATYETLFVQQRTRGDVAFEFPILVRDNRADGRPNFTGPFAQGPPAERFIYIDVGKYAGQTATEWARRMKVPLRDIDWPLLKKAMSTPGACVQARIPGRAKDGGPNCATVRLIGAWEV